MDKSAVREVAQKARQQLEEMVQKNLSALHACRLSGDDAFRRDILLKEEEQQGTSALCKKAAYRFFRELIAVRYMEVNGYLSYRVLSSQNSDTTEPDFLAHWLLTHQDTLDRDALFTKLFQKTCFSLASQMPDYFPVPDEMDLLLSLSYRKGVVRTLCDGLPEEEWLGQVELIGWLYQSYHLKEKNAAIDLYAGKVKMKNLTAATQFFTTDWVVRYMVENSRQGLAGRASGEPSAQRDALLSRSSERNTKNAARSDGTKRLKNSRSLYGRRTYSRLCL